MILSVAPAEKKPCLRFSLVAEKNASLALRPCREGQEVRFIKEGDEPFMELIEGCFAADR
jgi:hypothetical protein